MELTFVKLGTASWDVMRGEERIAGIHNGWRGPGRGTWELWAHVDGDSRPVASGSLARMKQKAVKLFCTCGDCQEVSK